MNYVCGFLMSWDLKRICFIKKNRPEWQKGLYNGVGGKIGVTDSTVGGDDNTYEFMETPKVAMAREFEEETGVYIPSTLWYCFHIETYNHTATLNKVYYFVSFGDEINKVKSMTDEEIVVLNYEDITFAPKEFVFNVGYIITMILAQIRNKTIKLLDPEGVNYS